LDFIDENLEMQDKDYDDILLGSKANAVSIHFEPKYDDESDNYVSLLMGELEQLCRRLKSSPKTTPLGILTSFGGQIPVRVTRQEMKEVRDSMSTSGWQKKEFSIMSN
jgi:hypothetical protein